MKASKHVLLTGICLLWLCFSAYAQLCPSNALAPVFTQDFGQGTSMTSTTAAAAGSTNYVYGGVGTDGNYVLTPSFEVSGKSDWTKLGDHTGNAFGNMFLVNAGGGKSLFFKQTVNGLCSGSTFNFSAWLANANTSSTIGVCGAGYKYPNVVFNIKNTGGTVLATFNTGNLPLSPVNGPANWQQYGFQFTLPAGTSSLVLEMVDYWGGAAACGNDLALDDILFTACTPQVTVSLSTATAICSGTSTTISTSLVNSPFTTPAYQWQKSTDNGVTWTNVGTPGTSANDYPLANVSATDGGIYRVLVGPDVPSLSSNSCITASNAISLSINSLPSVSISNSSPVCSGNPVALTATASGGTAPYSYLWSGPNGFASSTASSSIPTASTAASGTYSIILTDAKGCVLNLTTTVTVNATPVVAAISGISGSSGGCAGTGFTLNDVTPGGAWSSSNPAIASITNAGVVSLITAGTSVISYSVTSGGCSQAATRTITSASVKLQNDIIACNSGVIQFDQSPFIPTYSGSLPGDAYSWSFTSTNGSIAYNPGSTPASQYPYVQLSDGSVYTVALQYTTNGISCSDTQVIYKYIIPADTILLSHDTTVCNSTSIVGLSARASLITNSFIWSTTGTGSFSTPYSLTTDYTPSAADKTAGNIKIYLTGSSSLSTTGSCPSSGPAVDSMILRIVPVNTGTNTSQTICSNQALNFTPASSVPGSLFTWTSAVITGTATGNGVSGTGNITDVLVNPSASLSAKVMYTITPYSLLPVAGACYGAAFTFTVTIDPVAAINAITTTACSGIAFGVTPTNIINGVVPAGTTYNWAAPAVTGGLTGGAGATNAAIISGTLLNAGNTAQTATYTITPVSGSCTGSTFTINVTVNPVAVIDSMTAIVCSGTSFSFTPTNILNGIIPAGTTYNWSTPGVTGGLAGGAAATNTTTIAGILSNPSNIAQTATYFVTPVIASCNSMPFTVTVTITPVATITVLTTTTCSGIAFNVTPTNAVNGIIPAGTLYSWAAPFVTGGITGGQAGNNTGSIAGALINASNSTQTATYFITPVSGACGGNSFTVTVTVNPVAIINAITATTCSGASFSITPTNILNGIIPAGTVYSWGTPSVTGGLTNGATGAGSAVISGSLQNPSSIAQTATYVVTPLAGSCGGATFSVTVTVEPVAVINAMTTVICSGISFSFTPVNIVNGSMPGGTTYSWPAPNVTGGITGGASATNTTLIAGSLSNPLNTTQTATYTVTPVTGICSSDPFTVIVTVNPVVVVTAITTTTCSGISFSITPTNATNGSIPAGTIYSWGTPVVSGGLTGGLSATNETGITGTLFNPTNATQTATYLVTPVNGACNGNSFTVTVSVDPVAVIAAITTTTCSGISFSITPTNVLNSIIPAGIMYNWAAPVVTGGLTGGAAAASATTIQGSLNNTSSTVQTATYLVTPVAGTCTGNTFTVTVSVNAVAAINTITATTCSGVLFALTPSDIVNGIIPAATTYSWPAPIVTGGLTGGSGATNASSISGLLINPTNVSQTATYTITPVSSPCSGTPFTLIISVAPLAVVNAITVTSCSGAPYTAIPANAVNGIVPAGTVYSWLAPAVTAGLTGGVSGINAASITGTLINTGNTVQTATYIVTPVTGSCSGNSFTVTVTVDPVAVINAMTAVTCSGLAFSVTPTIINGIVPAGTTYSWSAPLVTGGLSGAAGAVNTISINGALNNATNTMQTATYTVTPVSGACIGSSFTVTLSVNPVAVINTITAVTCSGVSFSIVPANTVNGIVPAATTYSWPTPVMTVGLAGGVSATNAVNIPGTLINSSSTAQTATYTITPLTGVCDGASFTLTVTVNPVAVINAMTTGSCSGILFSITPTDLLNGNVPAGTQYNWTVPAVTGGLSGGLSATNAVNIAGTLNNPSNLTQTATYLVTPLSGNCSGTGFTLTVSIDPVATINVMTIVTCSGVSFAVTPVNTVNGIIPAGTSYSWLAPAVTGGLTGGSAAGSTNITGSLSNPTNTTQTATYIVTPVSGVCNGNAFTVIVTVNPSANIPAITATTCSGSAFAITPTNTINGIIPTGTTYSWPAPAVTGGIMGGAGATGSAGISGILNNSISSAQTATYAVTALSGACTGTPFTVTISVNAVPVITAMTAVSCSGAAFSLTPADITNGIIPSGTIYSWAAPGVTGGSTGGTGATGATDIGGTINNPTNTVQTATYSVTALSGVCSGAPFTVTVSINPTAVIAAITATSCSGISFAVTPTNNVNGIIPGGTLYSWATPAVTGALSGGAAATGLTNITGTLNNPTNSAQTATYFVTPVSGTCTGTPFTVTISIDPVPVVNAMTATTCSGVAFAVTPTDNVDGTIPAGTYYKWTAPAVTGGLTGGMSAVNAVSLSAVLTNPTNSVQTATYVIAPVSGSCNGTPFTFTVTVDPVAAINPIATITCSGAAFAITPVNIVNGIIPAGTTYSWAAPSVTGGLTGGLSITTANSINYALSNPTNTSQTATYLITPLSSACAGSQFTVTVTVNPVTTINAMTAIICSGTSFGLSPVNTINGIIPAGTTYSWAPPAVTGGLTGGISTANAPGITGTLNNPTNISQTATYLVTTLSGACTGSVFTVTVSVNPVAVVNALTLVTCSGASFTVTPTDAVNGIIPASTKYSWSLPATTGGITGAMSDVNAVAIYGSLFNTTNTTQTATYLVTPLSNSCPGNAFTVTVTIDPVASISAITTITCSGILFTVTPTNAVNGIIPFGTKYNWALPAVTAGLSGGISAINVTNIAGTLINAINSSQTATYAVTPVMGNCTGSLFTVTVTVDASAIISPLTIVTCSGVAFSITPTNAVNGIVPPGTKYSWTSPAVTGGLTGSAIATNSTLISGTLINTTNTAQTATYLVTPASGACEGSPFSVTVTVNPVAVINALTVSTCSGTMFVITPTGIIPAGTTYSWPAPSVTGGITGGATATNTTGITATLNNPSNTAQTATYLITAVSDNCQGLPFTVTVSVAPIAMINSLTATTCSGVVFTLTPASPGNGTVPSGTTYSWLAPAVTSALLNGNAANNATNITGSLVNITNTTQTATYLVTPVSGNCTGSLFTVTVVVTPVAIISTMTWITCSGISFTLTPTNILNGRIPSATTYSWSAPIVTGGLTGGTSSINTANVSGALINPTNTAQTATYSVTPLSGACTGNAFTVIVTIDPVAVVTVMTASACSGAPFMITPANMVNGTVPAGTLYNWNAPVVTGGLTGTAPATNATVIAGAISNPSNISQTATYSITAVSGNCANSMFTFTVVVRPLPKAEMNITRAIDCSPFTVDNSIISATQYPGSNAGYEWYVDNVLTGSAISFPSFVLTNDSAVIKLKTTSLFNCGTDNIQSVVKIHTSPRPSFTLSDTTGCGPLGVTVLNTTPDISSYQYKWDAGNGQRINIAQPGSVNYPSSILGNDTTYTIKLQAYQYCDTFSISKQIIVSRKAHLDFTAALQNTCSPLKVLFTNRSVGKQVQYHISYGDGTDSTTGTNLQYLHTYYTGTQINYPATILASNSCGVDSLVIPIVTSPNRVRVDLAISDSVVCGNSFALSLYNRTDSATSYKWDFGDGSPLQTTLTAGNITHTYQSPGTYLITNSITGTCSDTIMYRKFKVYPAVRAMVNTITQNNCIGTPMQFRNLSDTSLSAKWMFGDGTVSDSAIASHYFTQAGTYTAKLAVWKTYQDMTCTDTMQQPVTIVAIKAGRFTLSDSTVKCLPFTVSFINQNTGSIQTKWSWGDGQQSSGDSAKHTFTENGDFRINMEAKQPGGCIYADSATVHVIAPKIVLQYKGGAYCKQNNNIEFVPLTHLTDSIRWNFGDGESIVTTGTQTVLHNYNRKGSFIPKLTLVNNNCAIQVTPEDTIHIDEIDPGFKLTAKNDCAQTNYHFTDTSSSFFPITRRLWTLNQRTLTPTGDGNANAKEITQVYTKAGDYAAGLEVQNQIGCKATLDAKFNVQVYEFPQANINSINDACMYSLMEIKSVVNSQDSVIRRLWNMGNGTAATDSVVNILYSNAGNFTVKLTVGTVNSCYDSVYKQLSIHPLPALTIAKDKTICKGDTLQLKANGAVSYIWKDQNDNVLCNNCTEMKVIPQKSAQYKVIGYNEFGCSNVMSTSVKLIEPFKLSLLSSDSMCIGSSKRINVNGADNYQWLPTPGLSSYSSATTYATPAVTTTYKVIGKDGYNCFADTASIQLVIGMPTPVNVGKDSTVISGTPIQLNTGNNSPDIRQWQWGGKADYSCVFCQSPVVKVINDEALTVKATNQFGCITTDTLYIKTFCSGAEVFIPNAFTPDGDGINDVLVVQGRGIKVIKNFRIYTRWGEMVYEKNNFLPGDKSAGWDGKIRGKLANTDVFVYLCEAICEKGTAYTYKGNVAIIK